MLTLRFNGQFSGWTYVSRYQNVSILDFIRAKGWWRRVRRHWRHCRAHPKCIPLKNFANFPGTVERYDTKFYTLVTHSIVRKCGKFIDNMTLLQSWQLSSWDVIKNCLNYSRQHKHRKREHFLSREKWLECLPSPFTRSCQTTCKTRDSFINLTCGKLSHIFSSAIFNSETVLGFG